MNRPVTGIDIVYSYTSPLLESSKGINPNIVAIVVPLFGILGSLFTIFLVETCGYFHNRIPLVPCLLFPIG